jgi:hypothetical protein
MLKYLNCTALFLPLFVCGCYPTDVQPAVTGHETAPAVLLDANEKPFDSADGSFEEVDREKDAELVLVVDIFLPATTQPSTWRYFLRRIDSSTEHSQGTKLPSGFAACGQAGGYGGSIGLMGAIPTDGKVEVYTSIHWGWTNNKGSFRKDIDVPWLADMTQDVGSGASVRCHFEKPK